MQHRNFIYSMIVLCACILFAAGSCGGDDSGDSSDDTSDDADDDVQGDDDGGDDGGDDDTANPDVTIPSGDGEWIDTGFTIAEGDVLDLDAWGTVDLGAGGQGVSPDGLDDLCGAGCPNEVGHLGALTAKVSSAKDTTNGCVFEPGAAYSGRTNCLGKLFLIVNDIDYSDNAGFFSVHIKIRHPLDDDVDDDDDDDDADDDIDDDVDDDIDDDADDDSATTSTTTTTSTSTTQSSGMTTTTTTSTTTTTTIPDEELNVNLFWGFQPADLDIHMWAPCPEDNAACAATPGYAHGVIHIYYVTRGSHPFTAYFDLVLDDVTSFGPETVTVWDPTPTVGEAYRFLVHDYSNRSLSVSVAMSNSFGLRVEATSSDGMDTFTMPPATEATVWRVFEAVYDGDEWNYTSLDEYFFESDPSLIY